MAPDRRRHPVRRRPHLSLRSASLPPSPGPVDPAIGRFLTPDPAGFVDGPNLYAYVLNDPINLIDPSGLDCQVVTGSRIPRCDSQFIRDGGGGGGGTRPCTISFGDMVITEQCSRRVPFDPGRDFSIFFDPIFGRGPGPRMPFPTDIGPDPEPEMGMEEMEDVVDKILQCAGDQFGLTALGGALAAAGANILGTGAKTSGATPGTSLASRAASAVFGDARLPRSFPTLTGFPGVGRGLRVSFTPSVARFAGRAVPVIGYALLAYDAYQIGKCVLTND